MDGGSAANASALCGRRRGTLPPDYNPAMFSRANTALVAAGTALLMAGCEPSRDAQIEEHRATVQRYCLGCHDDAERTADLSLQSLPLVEVAAHAAQWEQVVRKL